MARSFPAIEPSFGRRRRRPQPALKKQNENYRSCALRDPCPWRLRHAGTGAARGGGRSTGRHGPATAPDRSHCATPATHWYWVGGHWRWENGAYVWEPGNWVEPQPGTAVIGAYWTQARGQWLFHPAHAEHISAPAGYVPVIAPTPPPPPRSEPMPAPPGAQYFWVNGHWNYEHEQYVWESGHWEAQREHEHWIAARWIASGNVWVYAAVTSRPGASPAAPLSSLLRRW